MIESPVIQEIVAERQREDIVKVLKARFGTAASSAEAEVSAVDVEKLDDTLNLAATCRSLASFRKKLSS